MKSALLGKGIRFYGSGLQVRDLLYIEDLLDAFELGLSKDLSGKLFNIGGGPSNKVSLKEVVSKISPWATAPFEILKDDWRPGDQRYYVSDTRQFERETGWRAQVSVDKGLTRLLAWSLSDYR
jgi:CDP-paratose 2-epimerase